VRSFFDWLKTLGPLGLFGIALVDGLGIPNPGGTDIALLALSIAQPNRLVLLTACAVAGSLIGSMIFFWAARKGGEAYLEKRASGPRAMRFRRWFHRYGLVTVFIPAVLPIPFLPLKVFVLCAGALQIRPLAFFGVMAAARTLRYSGLAYLGSQLGSDAPGWLNEHKWHLAGFSVFLFWFLYLMVKFADRERRIRIVETR
jgi:membrane protein YqaA with SNARE-associated domain